ncbi:MAG: HupE/UreJ family protein [Burkholderiales bacterium]
MSPPRAWVGCLCLLLWAWCSGAQAHKASDAYLTLQVRGTQVDERLDIALRDIDRDLTLDTDGDGRLTWGEVRGRWSDIRALANAVQWRADGTACHAVAGGTPQLDEHSDGRYAVLTRQWRCDTPLLGQELMLAYRLFAATDPTHRGIARVVVGPTTQTAVLGPDNASRRFDLADTALRPGQLLRFVGEGIHHILIGADHILFLLALLLPAVLTPRPPRLGNDTDAKPWRTVALDVVRVVTAFTVAHSITLGLAAFGLVNPPARWVESLIAASVVLAALNNLWPLVREGRWVLTFAFGLVHGFGFASALKDLGLQGAALAWPLLGFNLGVELGQLAIVALVLPLAWTLRHTGFYRRGVLRGGSALIAMLALVWLAERAFDIQLGS